MEAGAGPNCPPSHGAALGGVVTEWALHPKPLHPLWSGLPHPEAGYSLPPPWERPAAWPPTLKQATYSLRPTACAHLGAALNGRAEERVLCNQALAHAHPLAGVAAEGEVQGGGVARRHKVAPTGGRGSGRGRGSARGISLIIPLLPTHDVPYLTHLCPLPPTHTHCSLPPPAAAPCSLP